MQTARIFPYEAPNENEDVHGKSWYRVHNFSAVSIFQHVYEQHTGQPNPHLPSQADLFSHAIMVLSVPPRPVVGQTLFSPRKVKVIILCRFLIGLAWIGPGFIWK